MVKSTHFPEEPYLFRNRITSHQIITGCSGQIVCDLSTLILLDFQAFNSYFYRNLNANIRCGRKSSEQEFERLTIACRFSIKTYSPCKGKRVDDKDS